MTLVFDGDTKLSITVSAVIGGYKIVVDDMTAHQVREGFAPRLEQVPHRIRDMVDPSFQKKDRP